MAQTSLFSDGLAAIKHALADGVKHLAADQAGESQLNRLVAELGEFRAGLDGIRETLTGGISQM